MSFSAVAVENFQFFRPSAAAEYLDGFRLTDIVQKAIDP
jgi:hypothetical protein